MPEFDWHSGEITRATLIMKSNRGTQKVRRFFKAQCGDGFKFDRPFMTRLKAAVGKAMADAVDEWHRRQAMK